MGAPQHHLCDIDGLPLQREPWMVILLVLTLCFGSAAIGADATFTGKVIGVADGDTITVLHNGVPEKVRLFGIDAPERHQPFGMRAKQFVSNLAFGKVVEINPAGHDRWKRTIAEVVLPDGRYLNREVVHAGFAWWFRKYAPSDDELEDLEGKARAARRGLWADADPVPPWEWRASQRSKPAETGAR